MSLLTGTIKTQKNDSNNAVSLRTLFTWNGASCGSKSFAIGESRTKIEGKLKEIWTLGRHIARKFFDKARK